MKEIEFEPTLDEPMRDEIISELMSKLPDGAVVKDWSFVVKASLNVEVEAETKKERIVRYAACF
jgi:hypothetical protein